MEDETKVLSDEDQSKDSSDKAPTTQPMLKEILARVEAGFAEVNERISAGFAEVNDHLRKIDRRLGVLSDDVNRLRADSADYENRLKTLEDRKAS
jgi:hypothetical protein